MPSALPLCPGAPDPPSARNCVHNRRVAQTTLIAEIVAPDAVELTLATRGTNERRQLPLRSGEPLSVRDVVGNPAFHQACRGLVRAHGVKCSVGLPSWFAFASASASEPAAGPGGGEEGRVQWLGELKIPNENLNLYPTQVEDLRFVLRHHWRANRSGEWGLRVPLFMDMGTGKTIVCIALMLLLEQRSRRAGRPFRVVVLCKDRAVWRREMTKWGVLEGNVTVLEGNKRRKRKREGLPDETSAYHAYVTTTQTIISEHCDRGGIFSDCQMIICDEAHLVGLKDPSSKTSKILVPYLLRSRHVVLATGTPMPNGKWESYNLLRVLLCSRFPRRPCWAEFIRRYCAAVLCPKFGSTNMWEYRRKSSMSREFEVLWNHCLKPVVRRLKPKAGAPVPKKERIDDLIIRWIPEEEEFRADEERFLEAARDKEADENRINSLYTRVALNVADRKAGWFATGLGRRTFTEYLRRYNKVLLFAKHLVILDKAREVLESAREAGEISHRVETIRGDTDPSERGDIQARFNECLEPTVLCLSEGVAATSFTFYAQAVLCAELPMSQGTWHQMLARAIRTGNQNPTVEVCCLRLDSSISKQWERDQRRWRRKERNKKILSK